MDCDRFDECGHAGRPNFCAGDGRMHHHGRVHTRTGHLEWLCGSHYAMDRAAWIDLRGEKRQEGIEYGRTPTDFS